MPHSLSTNTKKLAKKILTARGVSQVLDKLLLQPARCLEALYAKHEITRCLTVKTGPFAGMRYPDAVAHGSVLFPKLVGCYERELHPVLERICRTGYSDIADIGCAEGYYAVGLAMRIPAARVHAYDTDPRAADSCREMARLNAVADRVGVHDSCSANMLAELAGTSKRLLVVCDCEGYEQELFPEDCAPRLRGADILVETHDFLVPGICGLLKSRFAATHAIEEIPTFPDRSREETFHYEDTRRLSSVWRARVLGEFRPAPQVFLFMRAR